MKDCLLVASYSDSSIGFIENISSPTNRSVWLTGSTYSVKWKSSNINPYPYPENGLTIELRRKRNSWFYDDYKFKSIVVVVQQWSLGENSANLTLSRFVRVLSNFALIFARVSMSRHRTTIFDSPMEILRMLNLPTSASETWKKVEILLGGINLFEGEYKSSGKYVDYIIQPLQNSTVSMATPLILQFQVSNPLPPKAQITLALGRVYNSKWSAPTVDGCTATLMGPLSGLVNVTWTLPAGSVAAGNIYVIKFYTYNTWVWRKIFQTGSFTFY